MPTPAKPALVRCRECGQAVARITGKTIRFLAADVTFRDGRFTIVCPVCGERMRLYDLESNAEAA